MLTEDIMAFAVEHPDGFVSREVIDVKDLNPANATRRLKQLCDRGDLKRERGPDGTYVYSLREVRVEPVRGSLPEDLRLIDLIDAGLLSSVYFELAHSLDEDAPYATVCGIAADNLSDDARREWADVLSAEVESVSPYCEYLWIDLRMKHTEEAMDRVKDFVEALAGYCTDKDYERWFPGVTIP